MVNTLSQNCRNSKSFWNQIKQLVKRKTFCTSSISAAEWVLCSESALNTDDYDIDEHHFEEADQYLQDHDEDNCYVCMDNDVNSIINCKYLTLKKLF